MTQLLQKKENWATMIVLRRDSEAIRRVSSIFSKPRAKSC